VVVFVGTPAASEKMFWCTKVGGSLGGKLETIYWHQAGAFPRFNSSFALLHRLTKSASDLKIARICSGYSENSAT
jgi:hypothetical protein